MNTAEHVIEKCGGVAKTAAITGRTISVVYRWTYEKSKGGTGGVIPRDASEKILAASERGEVEVTPQDFYSTHAEGISNPQHSTGAA